MLVHRPGIPIFVPLKDAAFLTEVHHVTGEGEDAGVVYCEMQATENTGQDRTDFCLLQNMYPGRCGYKVCVCITVHQNIPVYHSISQYTTVYHSICSIPQYTTVHHSIPQHTSIPQYIHVQHGSYYSTQ